MATDDKSNGYEEIASIFIPGRGRNRSGIGASVVAEWSQLLPAGATILDLGCGTGIPISVTLIARGYNVYGVDASPSMIAEFRANFPTVPVQCTAVEDSDFFGRTFDGVVAWGLFFLLDAGVQRQLITRIAAVLPGGGRLLFTAPSQPCSLARCHDRTAVDLTRPRRILRGPRRGRHDARWNVQGRGRQLSLLRAEEMTQ